MSEGDRLKDYWLAQNIAINPGTSEAALHKFESVYGVSLPPDLHEYFLTVNGMEQTATDEELIRFWKLEEVRPVSEEAPAYASTSYLPEAGSSFVFADYSIWAHAYSIHLSKSISGPNHVYVIGGTKPVMIAKSFSEFIDLYLIGKALDF